MCGPPAALSSKLPFPFLALFLHPPEPESLRASWAVMGPCSLPGGLKRQSSEDRLRMLEGVGAGAGKPQTAAGSPAQRGGVSAL